MEIDEIRVRLSERRGRHQDSISSVEGIKTARERDAANEDIEYLLTEIDRLKAENERLKNTCEWREDCDGNWETTCGNMFVFEVDGPSENGMKWCCYCGARLKEVKNATD